MQLTAQMKKQLDDHVRSGISNTALAEMVIENNRAVKKWNVLRIQHKIENGYICLGEFNWCLVSACIGDVDDALSHKDSVAERLKCRRCDLRIEEVI